VKEPLLHPETAKAIELFLKRPGHAVLLVGDKGSGKGHLSRYIADKVLKEQNLQTNIFEIDASAGAGIEEVRSLQAFLKLVVIGTEKLRRVVIIEHIDQLGHEAQNALLKSLEEPPTDTIFIGTTGRPSKLLTTIVSRMGFITVQPLTEEQIMTEFSKKYDNAEIKLAYHLSGGSAALVSALLSSPDENELSEAIQWAKDILRKTAYERLLGVDELSKEKSLKLDEYIFAIQKVLRASILHGKELSSSQAKRRLLQLEASKDARQNLELNVNAKLVLSNLFIKL